MKKIWIATYVDYGETCDGKPRTLGAYATEEEARNAVRSDIKEWADDRAGEDIEVDFDKMSATYNYDVYTGVEWNVEEVEIPE